MIPMVGHVPPEPELRLRSALQPAEDHVRQFDPSLRLRQSLRRDMRAQGCGYVLERKLRYEQVTHTETVYDSAGNIVRQADPDVRVASRDGYAFIDHVHYTRLQRPESIVEELKKGDHAERNGHLRFQDLVSDQAAAKRQRKEKRLAENGAFFREAFDILNRIGGRGGTERTRINNAGGEERFNVTDRRRVTAEGELAPGAQQETPSCPPASIAPS